MSCSIRDTSLQGLLCNDFTFPFPARRSAGKKAWVSAMGATTFTRNACSEECNSQRYTYRELQTIQMKLILLCVWAERAVLGSAKTALKFKYEIQIG